MLTLNRDIGQGLFIEDMLLRVIEIDFVAGIITLETKDNVYEIGRGSSKFIGVSEVFCLKLRQYKSFKGDNVEACTLGFNSPLTIHREEIRNKKDFDKNYKRGY